MRHPTKNFVLLVSFILFLSGTIPRTGFAEEICTSFPEAIEYLKAPRLGTYTLWDLVEGGMGGKTSFNDFVMVNEREAIFAGSEELGRKKIPLLKKIDRKGRTQWRWAYNGSDALRIIDLIDQEDIFWAVGQLTRHDRPYGIWIARFSKDGVLQGSHIISEPSKNLTYGSLIKGIKGGWLLALSENRVSDMPQLEHSYGRFITLDQDFRATNTRSFMPGPGNRLNDVIRVDDPTGERFYIAVGEIEGSGGRTDALVIRLDEAGNIVWQRTYARGNNTRLTNVSAYPDGSLLVTGEVQPNTPDAPNAAIAMKIDRANGTEFWQRYYMRNDIAYRVEDAMIETSGRSHLLLSGKSEANTDLFDHARLIALSPRGQILSEVGYTAGKGASPFRLREGPGAVLAISGNVDIEEPDPNNPEGERISSQKGWFIVGEEAPEYIDPCRIEKRSF